MQLLTRIFDKTLLGDTDIIPFCLPQDEYPTLSSSNGNPLWSSYLEISQKTDSEFSTTDSVPAALISFDKIPSHNEHFTPSSSATAENKRLKSRYIDPRLLSISKALFAVEGVDKSAIKPLFPLPVSFITTKEIDTILSNLQTPEGPNSPNLVSAIDATTQGRPLEALLYALEDFGLNANLKGEKSSILCFESTVPLRFSLSIVGQPFESDHIMDAQEEPSPPPNSQCRRIFLATDISFDQYIIKDIDSLITVLKRIIQIWHDLESSTGYLRPKPKTDAELFEILEHKNEPPFSRFSQANYEVENDCLLDACVSLLSPFGLRPHERAGQRVRFDHFSFDFEDYGIEIVRFDRFLSNDKKIALKDPFRSAVIFTGLRANTHEQREADLVRRVRRIASASGCMAEFNDGKFADKSGLVFSLHLEGDREDLVRRLLVHRDERVRTRKISTDRWRFGPHWMGKQGPVSVKGDEEMQELRKKVGKQAVGKPSLLKTCVNGSEALLEKNNVQEC